MGVLFQVECWVTNSFCPWLQANYTFGFPLSGAIIMTQQTAWPKALICFPSHTFIYFLLSSHLTVPFAFNRNITLHHSSINPFVHLLQFSPVHQLLHLESNLTARLVLISWWHFLSFSSTSSQVCHLHPHEFYVFLSIQLNHAADCWIISRG
jgi:hypothetical protein